MRRLMRELNELQTNPPEGIRVSTAEENMLDVTGIIQGPGASESRPPLSNSLTFRVFSN